MKHVKKVLLFVSLIVLSTNFLTYGGEWIKEGDYWKYDDNGIFVSGESKAIDGIWYLFDENGYMVKGLYDFDNKFYYFNDDGSPATGPINYNGKTFYISKKGEINNITEEEFYGYKDSLSALYIKAGGYDADMSNMLNMGIEQATIYFNTLPLSRKAFERIFQIKSYNNDAIKYMLDTLEINWKQQALKCAKEFYDKANINRIMMKNILLAEGFSEVEASYGTEMAFNDASLILGKETVSEDILRKNYLDKMSLAIINEKISDIYAKNSIANAENLIAATDASDVVNTNLYYIKSKNKKSNSMSIVDDDAEGGKVRIRITLPIPVIEGPKANEINNLINENIFVEVKKYIEFYYYDQINMRKEYVAGAVEILTQDANSITLRFKGEYDVDLVIDLNAMIFIQQNIIK